jgi:hypothetical protein
VYWVETITSQETNMPTHFLRVLRPLALAALVACGTDPIEPGKAVARPITSGKYELLAPGESRSAAWDSYAVRYEAILEIEQDSVDRSQLTGKFSRLDDESSPTVYREGILSGTIDERGMAIIELRSQNSQFVWTGRGIFVGTRISGQWATSNDEAGGFTAVLAK